MKAVTSAQMLSIEHRASDELGLDVAHLMERAGTALAEEYRRLPLSKRRAVVVCGKGNNGGDGFVAARILREAGLGVAVFHPGDVEELAPEARRAYERLPDDVAKYPMDKTFELTSHLAGSDGAIDALFGFGLKGGVRGIAAEVIEILNSSGKPVFAADLPSGLQADTGKVDGACVKASVTVTFTCPKIGLLLYPGAACAGRVVVADIGIPSSFVDETSDVRTSEPAILRGYLPDYLPEQHKWSRGGVFIIAGSVGMAGAAILAVKGAMRSGAGVVGVAAPASLINTITACAPEALTYPLPETTTGAKSLRLSAIEGASARYKAFVIGPGIGREKETIRLVEELIAKTEKPVVLDADGLFPYAGRVEALRERKGALVITPHSGELGRLLNKDAAVIEEDRVAAVREARETSGCTVVLKGARSLVASEDGVSINLTGNPGMATAGTGDVLSGCLGALIAQGLETGKAAELAVYLHGLAGDIAERSLSGYAFTASDIAENLPAAFKELSGAENSR